MIVAPVTPCPADLFRARVAAARMEGLVVGGDSSAPLPLPGKRLGKDKLPVPGKRKGCD